MRRFGEWLGKQVVKHKWLIVIASVILMVPSMYGYIHTNINYDILVYLPKDIETMKGQKILEEDFKMGSFAICSLEHMASKDIRTLEQKIKEIEGVHQVISPIDFVGTTIPLEILPDDISSSFQKGDSQLMLVTFEDSTTAIDAIREMREIVDDSVKIGGMSASTLDTSIVADQEIITYIAVAVCLVLLILIIALDSYLVPLLLLGNIGIAILYNMGTNLMFNEISYITKAIAAVLQLGVTTDFSIFLYHKYQYAKTIKGTKEEAMVQAVGDTLVSVCGSALTTVAGFLALCMMQLTLGNDIGIVMAKGVVIGVCSTVVLFPAMLLVSDRWIEKTKHAAWLPSFRHVRDFIIRYHQAILVIAVLCAIPAVYGNNHIEQYYNLTKDLPQDLQSSIANKELKEKFDIVSAQIILIDRSVKNNQVNEMMEKIEALDGVELVLSPTALSNLAIPKEMISDELKSMFENDQYEMIFINSKYETATSELNHQLEQIETIVRQYDEHAILAGEGPCMKDMVSIADEDFQSVNIASIGIIFLIMMLVLKSLSLPVLLVVGIELAIMVNMSFAFYLGDVLPFVASIVIGTIQLGATIDYAILMTTKYLEQRSLGYDKKEAMKQAMDQSMHSIFVSGASFFAATFGVGMISKLNMIASLCTLMARGAVISMIVVISLVPSLLLTFDTLIYKTSLGLNKKKGSN